MALHHTTAWHSMGTHEHRQPAQQLWTSLGKNQLRWLLLMQGRLELTPLHYQQQ
jgi:hypothetical protein